MEENLEENLSLDLKAEPPLHLAGSFSRPASIQGRISEASCIATQRNAENMPEKLSVVEVTDAPHDGIPAEPPACRPCKSGSGNRTYTRILNKTTKQGVSEGDQTQWIFGIIWCVYIELATFILWKPDVCPVLSAASVRRLGVTRTRLNTASKCSQSAWTRKVRHRHYHRQAHPAQLHKRAGASVGQPVHGHWCTGDL
eukprot:scaffold27464_cov107-Isochrysis_galbana.AAC.3